MAEIEVSRCERKKEETRQRNFQAAVKLFRERGFEATTVDDITEKADVAKGTFFNYFPRKDAVLAYLSEKRLIDTEEDSAAILGAKTMRANTGTSIGRIMPEAGDHSTGYPKNEKIVVFLRKCIESFRELAEYGEKVGVKITIENHWGLCANPMHPHHHGRGEPPLLRVHAGLLQLGE